MIVSVPGRQAPSKKKRLFRLAVVLAAILLLNLGGAWLGHLVNFQLFPRHDSLLHIALLVSIAIYVVLMATPFMPAIEVGLAVMVLVGSKSALLIYLCTLVALSISYTIGKYFPVRLVRQLLEWLFLHRASELLNQLEPLSKPERLNLLFANAPTRIAPFLLKHRFISIAVLLNLPGNALIGGGGGIGLVVGMSKLISFPKYFLVISLSVAPVPLWIYFQGL